MAQLNFQSGITSMGRGYLLCKELDIVATFENKISSVHLQIVDNINSQALIVTATKTKQSKIVLSVEKSTTVDFPQSWTIALNLTSAIDTATITVDQIPDGVGQISVLES